MKVQILIDNPNSWMVPHAQELNNTLVRMGHQSVLLHEHNGVQPGDILCMLSCEKKFKALQLNKHNLVVHESDLPLGRGMSPFTWQIVEGKTDIVISLLEATDEIDAGVIYNKTTVTLKGTELVDDWRLLQAQATQKLILDFVSAYPNVQGKEQTGTPSYYRKRNESDSKLDIHKSIAEQINLLRVVDNDRYPAWFEFNGEQYLLKIYKKGT